MTRTVAGVWAGVAAVACATAPVPKDAGRPEPYYPTKPGAKWVYARPGRPDETATVSAVDKAGAELVVSRAGADGNAIVYTKTAVSADGVRQIPIAADGAAVWLLKTPFKAGDSWDIPDAAGGGKRTAYGPEVVETEGGKWTAARVVWEQPGGNSRTTFWYALGVGEVKRVENHPDGTEAVVRSLKTFTPAR